MKATNVLIALCALVYIGELATGGPDSGRLVQAGQLYGPSVLVAHQWYRLASYGFLHASWLHIGLNMFALYQLGTFVEFVIGAPRMLVLYFISLSVRVSRSCFSVTTNRRSVRAARSSASSAP